MQCTVVRRALGARIAVQGAGVMPARIRVPGSGSIYPSSATYYGSLALPRREGYIAHAIYVALPEMHFSFVKRSSHQFCIQILSRCISQKKNQSRLTTST